MEITEGNRLYMDNTRVSTFFKCPRLFYLRHIRGWVYEEVRTPLIFGGAIHRAMDGIWANQFGSQRDQVDAAYTNFCQEWVDRGGQLDGPIMDIKRNPGVAMGIISGYVSEYHEWLKQIEVLEVEKPFAVYLTTIDGVEIWYIGRWDKAYRRDKRVYIGEHKTTSIFRKATGFAREWMESFSPDNQVDGYQYSGLGVYGREFAGVVVDGLLVHKTHRRYKRIPVNRSIPNLRAWVWETAYWVNEILENWSIIRREDIEQHQYLPAFPKRTEQCQHKYGQCGFLKICKYAKPNLEHVTEPPQDYIAKPWDPFTHNVAEGEEPIWVDTRKKGVGEDEEAVLRPGDNE